MRTKDEVRKAADAIANDEAPDVQSCGTCFFAAHGPLSQHLQRPMMCRRFPPQAIPVPTPQGLAATAMSVAVSAEYWCGEYQAGEPATLDAPAPEGTN